MNEDALRRERSTARIQGRLWGERARDWAAYMESKKQPLFQTVLEHAGIGAGAKVLDVGCGAGTFCALAASRGACAVGVDASRKLLETAREREEAAGFLQAEMQELPFADRCFDAVTGFNAFQYAAEPDRALREAARVAKRGARAVVAVWGEPGECDAAEYIRALSALLPPRPPGSPGPFALSEDGALREFARRAGLKPETQRDVDVPWEYPDRETAIRALLSSGPAAAAIGHAGEERVRETIGEVLQPFRTGSGGYRLRNKLRYLLAHVE